MSLLSEPWPDPSVAERACRVCRDHCGLLVGRRLAKNSYSTSPGSLQGYASFYIIGFLRPMNFSSGWLAPKTTVSAVPHCRPPRPIEASLFQGLQANALSFQIASIISIINTDIVIQKACAIRALCSKVSTLACVSLALGQASLNELLGPEVHYRNRQDILFWGISHQQRQSSAGRMPSTPLERSPFCNPYVMVSRRVLI